MSVFAHALTIPEIACDLGELYAEVARESFVAWCPRCDTFIATRVFRTCGHGCCQMCYAEEPSVCQMCAVLVAEQN